MYVLVVVLQRSIYGLVQASRSWNIRFDEMIKVFGFTQTYGEACVYKKVSGSSVAFQKYSRIFKSSLEFEKNIHDFDKCLCILKKKIQI